MKQRIAITAIATAIAFGAAPTYADNMTEMEMGKEATRVLRVASGLCPGTIDFFKGWAVGFDGHGSYAVPTASRELAGTCENPGPAVRAGHSFEFTDRRSAHIAALELCNADIPEGYGPCNVIAYAHDR